jgi:hypothetical protein
MRMETQRFHKKGSQLAEFVRARSLHYRQYIFLFVLSLLIAFGSTGTAVATQTSTSPHYSVTETQFGAGSQEHQCSSTYCAKSSAGDTTVGNASSANFSAQFGSNTSDVPLLEVIVDGGNQDLGTLDDTHTATAVSTLKVRNYLMQGYAIEVAGDPPKAGSHSLTPLTVPTANQTGKEQFGINMVANTAPGIGADPIKVPFNASALSYISSGYSNSNLYKYVNQDIVAENREASGETHYTISMILNISGVTPGGQYKSAFSAVVVPFY